MLKIFNRFKKKMPAKTCNTCKHCRFNVDFRDFFCRNSKSKGNGKTVALDDYCKEWED